MEHEAGGTVIKDSGHRRVWETGAHRDMAAGKGAFHLLPYDGIEEVAKVFEAGASKYTANNYRLGIPLSSFADSGVRHAIKAAQGWSDENHAAQAAWNFLCFIQTRAMIRRGQLPETLNDIHDWLSDEGVEKAFAAVRAENDRRLNG